MAGSVSVEATSFGNGILRYAVSWTASAGGAVSGNAFAIVAGRLLQVKFVPSDESALQPDAAYDVTLLDADNADLLRGTGANLSDTVSVLMPALGTEFIGYVAAGNVDLVVANVGNAKAGRVDLLIGP